MQEFKQGCEGLCLVGGACYLLGRWLEKNMTPDICEIKQFRLKKADMCVAYIYNEPVAKLVYEKVKKQATYDRVVYVTKMALECTKDYISGDIPVPVWEADYWRERLKELKEKIENFYISAEHEHYYTIHLHFTYREPTPSGFRKFSEFLNEVRSEKRPKLGEHT